MTSTVDESSASTLAVWCKLNERYVPKTDLCTQQFSPSEIEGKFGESESEGGEYNCILCTDICTNMMMSESCQHYYCRSCLIDYISNSKDSASFLTQSPHFEDARHALTFRCSQCTSQSTSVASTRFVNFEYMNARIRGLVLKQCPHGCGDWAGAGKQTIIEFQRTHDQVCRARAIVCSFCQAGIKGGVTVWKRHVYDECDKRIIDCLACGQRAVPFGKHQYECHNIPVKCNECKSSFPASAAASHLLSQCVEVRVPCPFCKEPLRRRNLTKHYITRCAKRDLIRTCERCCIIYLQNDPCMFHQCIVMKAMPLLATAPASASALASESKAEIEPRASSSSQTVTVPYAKGDRIECLDTGRKGVFLWYAKNAVGRCMVRFSGSDMGVWLNADRVMRV